MCTYLFAYKNHPKYNFIFLGNRDEYNNRPSLRTNFWASHPNVLAGIDLEKGGTWAGITKEGRMAFVTNYRDFSMPRNSILSRGYLPREFLISSISPLKYLQDIQLHQTVYDPFNLIVGTQNELYYYSNIENQIRLIQPGIYGLSNALLDTPWFKVKKAKDRFSRLLNTNFSVNQLFDILDYTEVSPDEELPHTGLSLDKEKALSSIYIDTPTYGTQYKIVILISTSGEVRFYEKAVSGKGCWDLNTFVFNFDKG